MTLWTWKVATPLLIALVTLAGRRWGHAVAGVLVGLPLTSGPTSVFLAVEQGHRFARAAAVGTLLGLTANVACTTTYYIALASLGPASSAAIAVLAFLLTAGGLSEVTSGPGLATSLGVIAALIGTVVVRPSDGTSRVASPSWDLPLRMLTAGAVILLITAAARVMGPFWSGVLSPFPVFSLVLTVFAHRQSGPGAAADVMRGVAVGIFASLGFFITVAYLVDKVPLTMCYGLAGGAALTASGIAIKNVRLYERHSLARIHGQS